MLTAFASSLPLPAQTEPQLLGALCQVLQLLVASCELISGPGTYPEGKVAKVYRGVNPAHHSDEVLADLDGLQKL